MPVTDPPNWLVWHSGRKAQEHAVRLTCACSAVLPSDKNLKLLVEEQIISDLIGLAIHGRRTMEKYGAHDTTLDNSPLWPAPEILPPEDPNLRRIFGLIVHSHVIEVKWDTPDLTPNPYSGREPRFAGSVSVKSSKSEETLAIGSIVSAYIRFGNTYTMQNNQPAPPDPT